MNTIDHLDLVQFASLVKGRKLTTREQDLLRSVEKFNWRTYSLNLSNSLHGEFAANAVALDVLYSMDLRIFMCLLLTPIKRLSRADQSSQRKASPSSWQYYDHPGTYS